MEKRFFKTYVFLSWMNGKGNDRRRAIAPCDSEGFFCEAINCLRDGSMGEPNEDGVYERTWLADYVDCYGDEHETLRPATKEEVALYLKYVSLARAVGADGRVWPAINYSKKVVDVNVGFEFSAITVQYDLLPWWKRFVNNYNERKQLHL